MRLQITFVFGLLLFVGNSSARAQTASQNVSTSLPAVTTAVQSAKAADTAVSYDASALRIESHWGDYRIVRGTPGTVVGTVGLLRSFDVEQLVARSPVAAAEARAYQTNHLMGSIVGTTGLVALATGLIMSSNTSNNASTPILVIGGAGAIAWAGAHLNTAYSALSRALWWYNRDLPR